MPLIEWNTAKCLLKRWILDEIEIDKIFFVSPGIELIYILAVEVEVETWKTIFETSGEFGTENG